MTLLVIYCLNRVETNMRINIYLCAFLVAACSLTATAADKAPTDAEQVAGIQKMCTDSGEAIKARQAQKSLYLRLGKRAKIKVWAQKLLDAHSQNKTIGNMFAHVKKDAFVRNVTDFLVAGTGGKSNYRGKDMATAHKNLNITNGDFLSAGGDVQAVMKEMKYGDNEIQEVICSLASFIPVVVVQK